MCFSLICCKLKLIRRLKIDLKEIVFFLCCAFFEWKVFGAHRYASMLPFWPRSTVYVCVFEWSVAFEENDDQHNINDEHENVNKNMASM